MACSTILRALCLLTAVSAAAKQQCTDLRLASSLNSAVIVRGNVTLKREPGLPTRQTSVPSLRVAALLRARTGASKHHSSEISTDVVLMQVASGNGAADTGRYVLKVPKAAAAARPSPRLQLSITPSCGLPDQINGSTSSGDSCSSCGRHVLWEGRLPCDGGQVDIVAASPLPSLASDAIPKVQTLVQGPDSSKTSSAGSVQWRLRPFSYGQALAFLRGPWAVHCACVNDGGLVTCSATPLVAAAVLGAAALLLLLILLLGWTCRRGHVAPISSTQQSDTDASGAIKDSLTPSVRHGHGSAAAAQAHAPPAMQAVAAVSRASAGAARMSGLALRASAAALWSGGSAAMQLLPSAVVRGNRASCGASSEADSAAAMTPCSLLDSAMIDSRASGGHMWIEGDWCGKPWRRLRGGRLKRDSALEAAALQRKEQSDGPLHDRAIGSDVRRLQDPPGSDEAVGAKNCHEQLGTGGDRAPREHTPDAGPYPQSWEPPHS